VYFWDWRGLNQTADTDDVRTITLRINGGLTGLAEREKLLQKLKQQLADLEAQEAQEAQEDREPGSPITVPVTERKIPAYVVAATSLNLRSQPAIRSDTVITRLPAGTAVAKLEQAADPGWWKIQTEIAGRLLEGYVAAEYLAPRKLPPDHSVAVMLLNLRSRPEVAANTRLALMAQGTPVARLEPAADPEWWKIQVELHGALLEGYVAYRYLTPIKKAPTHRVVATLLNLRSKPVIAADTLLTRLPQNLPVAVLTAADQAGWLKIQVELEEQLLEGYVADEYLAALGK
jgi:uncharacterized protein YgiM (DUF1202 family)